MRWDPKQVNAKAAEAYEREWMRTIDLIPNGDFVPRKRRGKENQVNALEKTVRSLLLDGGFDEVALPYFMDEHDIYSQRGPEALLAFAEAFYLSSSPRKRVELTDEIISRIQKIAPSFDEKKASKLQNALNEHAKGKPGLAYRLVDIGFRMEQVSEIINVLFKHEIPSPSTRLLRNNLASSWFETISVLLRKEPLPLQLFSIGKSFKNVESNDRDLRVHSIASFVLLDEGLSMDNCLEFTKQFLAKLGADKVTTRKKKATAKIFIPGTEQAVYVNGIEIGSVASLSPIALSAYDIEVPCFIASIGIERMALSISDSKDIRAISYPQFYGAWELSDKEIANLIKVAKNPVTDLGREISKKIVKTCELYGGKPAPGEFKLMERDVGEQNLQVWLVEDEQKTFCGRDYLNEYYVFNGNVFLLPPSGQEEARVKGVRTGLRPLDAFAEYAGWVIESGLENRRIEVGLASPADANVFIPAIVKNYCMSKAKQIDSNIELFIKVESRVKPLWKHEQPR